MMTWIKCTDRMPPDMEPVMAMMSVDSGPAFCYSPVRRFCGEWECLADCHGMGYEGTWIAIEKAGIFGTYKYFSAEINHWMPIPGPAKD